MRVEHKRRWLRFVAVIACVGLLTGLVAACGGDDDSGDEGGETAAETTASETTASETTAASDELTEVHMMIPFPPSIALLGLVIGQEQGYFEAQGIDLQTDVATEGSGQVNQLLIAGRSEFGRSGPDLTMIANSEGHDVRMLAVFARGLFTIEDLKGKSIGITDLAGGEVGLVQQALAEAGLKENEDVEIKVVGPGGPAAYRALESGQIAAYAAATNDFAAMDAQGLESVSIVPESLQGLPSNGFVTMQKTVDDPEKLDAAIRTIRAWLQGDMYARENPEEALKMACDAVPEDCTNMNTARHYLERSIEAATPPDGVLPGANEPRAGLETIQDSLIAGGDMDGKVDLDTVFPETYTEQINEGLEEGL